MCEGPGPIRSMMDPSFLVILLLTLWFISLFRHVSLMKSDWLRNHIFSELAIKYVQSHLWSAEDCRNVPLYNHGKKNAVFVSIVKPTVSSEALICVSKKSRMR